MRGHAENDRGGPCLKCRNCGGEFSAERAELGYDYCTSPACVEACLEPLNVVAVGVLADVVETSDGPSGAARTAVGPIGTRSRVARRSAGRRQSTRMDPPKWRAS